MENYTEDEKGNLILDDGTVVPKETRQRTEIYSRVVGYYRSISMWNEGKAQEFKERKTFDTTTK